MLTSAFFVSVLSIFTLQYSAFLVCNKQLVNKELIGRLVLALAYTNQNWKIPIPAKYYSKRLCRDLRLIHIRR